MDNNLRSMFSNIFHSPTSSSTSPTSWPASGAAHRLPRQGDKAPWKVLSNYLYDLPRLRYGRLNDDALEFVKAEGGKRRRLGVSRG